MRHIHHAATFALFACLAPRAGAQVAPADTTGRASPPAAPVLPGANRDTVFWQPGRPDCDERYENGVRWRRTLVQGADTFIVSVARLPDPNYLLLGLHVFNAGQRSVTVDPTVLSLGVRRPGDSTWTSFRPWTRSEVVGQVEKRYKRQRRGATFSAVLSAMAARYRGEEAQTRATVVGPGGITTVNATTTTTPNEPSAADVAQHRQRIAGIDARESAERAAAQSGLLAVQTVDARRYVVGGVAFELQPKAQDLVLMVPIGRGVVWVAVPPESTQ